MASCSTATVATSLDDSTNWFIANLAGDICLREALLEILHNSTTGLPKDGKELYQRMVNFKKNCEQNLQKVLHKPQWDKICPPSGESNSDDWDITIIKVIIQYEKILLPPHIGGWERQSPATYDTSRASFVCRAKDMRNELKHGTVQELTNATGFADLMDRIEYILNGLGYSKMHVFNDLKTCRLEAYTGQTVKLLKATISELQDDIQECKKNKADVTHCTTKIGELKAAMKVFSCKLKDPATEREIYELLTKVSNQQEEIESIQESMKILSDNQDNLRESQENLKTEVEELKKISGQKNITSIDVEKCLITHREAILKSYSEQKVRLPIKAESCPDFIQRQREDVFVDLSIIRGDTGNNQLKYSECEGHLMNDSKQKEYVTIKKLLQGEEKCLLVEGVAGIGKTQLIETIVLKWAKGEILNGEDEMPNIHLLLPIKCRELNNCSVFSADTNESILKKLFPDVFKSISLEDLEEKGRNVMFVIDGLDELMSVEQINKPNTVESNHQQKILHFMKSIIVDEKGIVCNQYTIIAGRPRVIHAIKNNREGLFYERIKRAQVCGFNRKSVEEYIQKHCDPPLQKKVTEEIESSEYLSAMSQIPVYLWVICNIYKEDLLVPAPRTTTELMVYACLVFIRNHLLDSNSDIRDLSFQEICERDDVIKLILCVAKISFTSLTEGKVIFESQEMQDLDSNAEDVEKKLGFLVKTQKGESGCLYQFVHLVLQEFFTAIHIFLSNELLPIVTPLHHLLAQMDIGESYAMAYIDESKIEKKLKFIQTALSNLNELSLLKNVSTCLPIIAGLEGMAESSNSILQLFVQKLKANSETKDNEKYSLMEISHHWFWKELATKKQIYRRHSFLLVYDCYLRCLFENDCDLPANIVNYFRSVELEVEVKLSSQFQLRLLIHFFKKMAKHHNENFPIDKMESILKKLKELEGNCLVTFTLSKGQLKFKINFDQMLYARDGLYGYYGVRLNEVGASHNFFDDDGYDDYSD